MIDLLPLGVTGVMLPDLDFDEQVALCGQLGVTHYVFRPRHIPESARGGPWRSHGNHRFDLTPRRLIQEGPRFKAALEAAGMVPFCTVPAGSADVSDDTFREDLEAAAAAGCGRIKVTPPGYPKGLFDYPAYLEKAIGRYEQLCAMADPHGIKVVIEMHAGTTATSPGLAYNLVRSFDPARLGVIIDLPNFAREGFVQPELAVSVLRPWIDHVHLGGLRRTQGEYDAHGFRQTAWQMCPLSESDLHIPTWLRTLADAATGSEGAPSSIPLIIEDYTANLTGALKLRLNAEAATRLLRELAAEAARPGS